MNTSDRIERAKDTGLFCDFIKLEESEHDHYHGCGRGLAKFKHGVLVELQYFNRASSIGLAAAKGMRFAEQELKDGEEIYLVFCSCFELCQPIKYRQGQSKASKRLLSDWVTKEWQDNDGDWE